MSGYDDMRERQAIADERASLVTQLEQMRRERDNARAELAMADCALLSARATNAKLHRRAQGVDARKPEDEETIRRLRAEVRAMAKHAGCVAGHVYRLQMEANYARHAASEAVRERDEARATIDAAWNATGVAGAVRGLTTLDDVVQCHRHDLMEARAKLARIREVAECDYHDAPRAVLRIIDEKEGGQ